MVEDNTNNSNRETSNEDAEPGTSSTAPKPHRWSKTQEYQQEITERILSMAEKEDDPVDLELASLGARIKRKLQDSDERDELLDELNEVARSFFFRKKRKLDRTEVATAVQVTGELTSNSQVISRPPPPLQMQPQIQQQIQPPMQGDAGNDMLFKVSGLAPMQQYNTNLQYVSDPTSGNTYMKV